MNNEYMPNSQGHHELLTFTIFESNEYEPEIVEAIAEKSTRAGTITLYTIDRYNTIKIYEIGNLGYSRKNTSVMNVVNCIKKSDGAITLSEANLYSRNSFIMEPYSCYQDQDYNHIIHTHKMIPIDLEIVYEGIKNLK